MIRIIARIVEVCVTLGPGPPCAGGPIAPNSPRAVVLLRRTLGAALPAPGGWATMIAWHIASAAGKHLIHWAARPGPDHRPRDPRS